MPQINTLVFSAPLSAFSYVSGTLSHFCGDPGISTFGAVEPLRSIFIEHPEAF
jgi:hypothetical protein